MNVKDYVKVVESTDRLERAGPVAEIAPVMGLTGEVGSLLTELKKQVREPNRSGQQLKIVSEELGDILWYAVSISSRANLDFQTDVLHGNLQKIRN